MRNIEIKLCRPDKLSDSRFSELLTEMGARHVWDRHQSDTFWHTQSGWLKLREVDGDESSEPVTAELIGYQRSTGTSDALAVETNARASRSSQKFGRVCRIGNGA